MCKILSPPIYNYETMYHHSYNQNSFIATQALEIQDVQLQVSVTYKAPMWNASS